MNSPAHVGEITVALSAGAVGIRKLFAYVALNTTRHQTADTIAALKADEEKSFALPGNTPRKAVADLRAALKASKATFDVAQSAAQKMELSTPLFFDSIPNMKAGIKHIAQGLIDVLKTTAPDKIASSPDGRGTPSVTIIADAAQRVVDAASPEVVRNLAKGLEDFAPFTRGFPLLAKQPVMQSFFSAVATAYSADAQESIGAAHAAYGAQIEALPKRNAVDVILGTNRPATARYLYKKAEQAAVASLEGRASTLAKIAEHQDAATALASLLEWPMRKDGRAVTELREGAVRAATTYAGTRTDWEDHVVKKASFNLRPALGKAAIATAIHEAEGGLQEFRNRSAQAFRPEGNTPVPEVAALAEVVKNANEGRKAALGAAAGMKIPVHGKIEDVAALNKNLADMHTSMAYAFRKTYNRKVSTLIRDEVEHRMGKTAEQLAEAPPLPLNALDGHIMKAIDSTGFIDASVMLHEFAQSHLPDFVVDTVDLAGDILFPGAVSGGKALFREAKMLLNDETTLSDAFVHGILPAAAKTSLVGIGMAIDTMFGWATFGAFTAAGYAASHVIKTTGPEDEIKNDVGLMQPHFTQLQQRRAQAVEAINNAVTASFKDFPALTAECPALADEPKMRLFMSATIDGYGKDAAITAQAVRAESAAIIQSLPAPASLDHILGINRSREVAKLYNGAAEEVAGHILKTGNEFARDIEFNPEKLVAAMRANGPVPNGHVTRLVAGALPDIEIAHFVAVQEWKLRCVADWTKGMAKVDAVSTAENSQVTKLNNELQPRLEGPRMRIKANLRRLGKDPNLCP